MEFVCMLCGSTFKRKHHLQQHLRRKIPCSPLNDTCNLTQEVLQKNKLERKYGCKFCDKKYTQISNRSAHQKICPNNIDKNNGKNQSLVELNAAVKDIQSKLNSVLSKAAPNVTNVNNVTNNIIIMNNFGNENYDHLSESFIKSCVKQKLQGVEQLVESIHFHADAPHNMNIRHKSIRDNLVEVRHNDKWVVRDSNTAFETMIRKSSTLMSKVYHACSDLKELDDYDDMAIQTILINLFKSSSQEYMSIKKRIRALVIEYTRSRTLA